MSALQHSERADDTRSHGSGAETKECQCVYRPLMPEMNVCSCSFPLLFLPRRTISVSSSKACGSSKKPGGGGDGKKGLSGGWVFIIMSVLPPPPHTTPARTAQAISACC